MRHDLGWSGGMNSTRRANQWLPRLMHECRWLQSLARRFAGHPVRREFAQLLIDEREQFLGSFGSLC